MFRDTSNDHRHSPSAPLLLSVLLIVAALALAAAGCSASSASAPKASSGAAAGMPQQASSSKMSPMAKPSADATGMKCIECSAGGKAAAVKGETTVESGKQVVKISLKNGQYYPNVFTAQAGMPVVVSFNGTSSGCLGHPMFKSLGKSADLSKGSASMDLGSLKPGVYKFSCSMGMNVGTITVE